MKTLIVGSDSLIGKALMENLNREGSHVIGTTRRRELVDKSHLFLDLSEGIEPWECPSSVNTAVICAGITSIEACKNYPAESRRINVDAVLKLIRKFLEKGIFIIYLSSDKVFDGSKPYRKAEEPLSPITEYGKQKAEVERQICGLKSFAAIMRFTKVLGFRDKLFSVWREALEKNEIIYPFSDVVLAPLPLSFVVKVISDVIQKRLSGILQVSGNRDISYAEAAQFFAKLIGAEDKLVQPVSACELGIFTENVSRYTSLDTKWLKEALSVEPPDIYWIIKDMFTEQQATGACNDRFTQ